MKRFWVALILAMGLAIPAAALAANGQEHMNVVLPKGETHSGTYYAAGQTVTIDGNVNGDVVCAGQSVTVNGTVAGDVICAAQTITINGPVSGSVRVVAQSLNINGTVGRNVTVAGQSITLGSGAAVSGEVAAAGQTVTLNGQVSQNVNTAAQSLTLAAPVGGSVNARINDLTMGAQASVAGDLTYTSPETLAVSSTQVHGTVSHRTPPQRHINGGAVAAAWLGGFVYWTLAALAATLLAVWLVPRLIRSVTDMMLRRVGPSFGWGFVGLLLGPVILVAVALTVIGVPLALLVGTLWLLTVAASGAMAGVAAGRVILGRKTPDQRNLALAALAGVPVVELVLWLPWLGWLVGVVAAAWVIGGLLLSLNRARALA